MSMHCFISKQVLAFVGLWEVRQQILDHHEYTRRTISLAGAYARRMRLDAAGTVIPDDLFCEIREAESKLPCPFNRKLAFLLALALNDGFVVMLTEAMPADFDGDWSIRSHRCEYEKRHNVPMQYRVCTRTSCFTMHGLTDLTSVRM
jgi:hypothetical protein